MMSINEELSTFKEHADRKNVYTVFFKFRIVRKEGLKKKLPVPVVNRSSEVWVKLARLTWKRTNEVRLRR